MPWPFAAKSDRALDLPEKSTSPHLRFAFKLFRQLAAEREPGNIFFSPTSVMLCLWLLQEGAAGETRQAMAKVLEVADLEPEALQRAVGALTSALTGGPGLELEAANSLWCNREWEPRSEYVAALRQAYDAEVIGADFRDAETVARINSWVAAKTRGKIGSILNSIGPLTALVAINTIYFKGVWNKPFEPELTREEPFHTRDGRKLRVPLMSQYGSYPYYEESGFQAVRLPYRGSGLAMYVFLPAKKSSLQRFRETLNSAGWDKWMRKWETVEGHIRLPRFKLTYQADLNDTLIKLGMGIAFERQRARFDGIHLPPPEIWIGRVLHRAFVEVNEEGTEAAAVTAAMVCLSSRRPSKPPRTFEMTVDRPFFFAIGHHFTNQILFMGSVEQPEA